MMARKKKLVCVIGIRADKVGGIETLMREMADQLPPDWELVACFEDSPSGESARFLDTPNLHCEALGGQSGGWGGQALASLRLLARHRPAVFFYSFHGVVRPFPWLARAFGARRVVYNDQSSRPSSGARQLSQFKRAIARFLCLPVDRVICVSDYVRRCQEADSFVSPRRLSTVYTGVDLSRNTNAREQAQLFRRLFAIPEDKPIVLQVSWLVPAKGIDRLLQAAAIVLREFPAAHFVVVGKGEHEREYREMANQLGIQASVTWTGRLENPTAEGPFAAGTIYVQLSQWQEAFGLVIAEAMSFGLPVVGTRAGGIPEVIADGETGFLVDCRDTAAVAEKLLFLLRNPDMSRCMGAAARKRCEQLFDVRKTARAYLQHCGVLEES